MSVNKFKVGDVVKCVDISSINRFNTWERVHCLTNSN